MPVRIYGYNRHGKCLSEMTQVENAGGYVEKLKYSVLIISHFGNLLQVTGYKLLCYNVQITCNHSSPMLS